MRDKNIKKQGIDPRLKPFFDKARKNGWCEGKHIFAYLDEIDNIRYDNIRDSINARKLYSKILKQIKALKDNDAFHENYKKNILGSDDIVNKIIDAIIENLKGNLK